MSSEIIWIIVAMLDTCADTHDTDILCEFLKQSPVFFLFLLIGELRSLWQQCVFKNMNIEPLFCFQAFSGDFVAWGFWSNFTCYRYFSYSFSLHDFVLVFFTLYLIFPVSCFGWAMLESETVCCCHLVAISRLKAGLGGLRSFINSACFFIF